jgi:hypothetical protein
MKRTRFYDPENCLSTSRSLVPRNLPNQSAILVKQRQRAWSRGLCSTGAYRFQIGGTQNGTLFLLLVQQGEPTLIQILPKFSPLVT